MKNTKFRFDQFDEDNDGTNYYILNHDENNSPSTSSVESNRLSLPESNLCSCPDYVNQNKGYMNTPTQKLKRSQDLYEKYSLNYTNINHNSTQSSRSSSTTSLARYGCDVSYTNIDLLATDAIRKAARESSEFSIENQKLDDKKKQKKKSSKGKKTRTWMCLPVSLKLGH